MTDPDSILRQALIQHQTGCLTQARVLYQQVLAARPADHDALHLLGVLLAAQDQPQRGIALIRRSVALHPGFAAAHFNLGGLLLTHGQPQAALASLLQCLALAPTHAGALAAAGRCTQAMGRSAEAIGFFARAVAQTHTDPLLWSDMGTALYASGRFQEALAAYDEAVRLRPEYVDAHFNRGCVLLARQAYGAAATAFEATLTIQPAHSAALLNLSITRQAQGRTADALGLLDHLLTHEPAHTQARLRRAELLAATDRHVEAVADFSAVLAVWPDSTQALTGRGGALWMLLDLDAAAADLDRALALDPLCVPALIDRGNVLQDRQQYDAALASYDQALTRQPDHFAALINRGAVLQALQRPTAALLAYRQALAVQPDDADTLMNLGMCLLRMGQWSEGWQAYEHRLRLAGWLRASAGFDKARWDGRAGLRGKRILLVGEQGLGDIIQFSRFAQFVADRGATVILGVEPPLRRLMQGIAGVSEIAVPGDQIAYDLYCPLLSLPAVCHLDSTDVATHGPYLQADPIEVAVWRNRLAALPGMKVGLAWAGDPRPHDRMATRIDRRRSVALHRLALLLATPGVVFVSLQKGQAAYQANDRPIVDWTADLHDYADTAALMTALDLVISVDTSVVHAAGALGRPVWLLNRFDSCWRWMQGRNDTPWYPTMRLFTQRTPDGWEALAAEVAGALTALSTKLFN